MGTIALESLGWDMACCKAQILPDIAEDYARTSDPGYWWNDIRGELCPREIRNNRPLGHHDLTKQSLLYDCNQNKEYEGNFQGLYQCARLFVWQASTEPLRKIWSNIIRNARVHVIKRFSHTLSVEGTCRIPNAIALHEHRSVNWIVYCRWNRFHERQRLPNSTRVMIVTTCALYISCWSCPLI